MLPGMPERTIAVVGCPSLCGGGGPTQWEHGEASYASVLVVMVILPSMPEAICIFGAKE